MSARIEIIGNLGGAAEGKETNAGAFLLSFSVANTPRSGGDQEEYTNWYRCTFMGKRAEAVEKYLVKGKKVFVRGDFAAREWENRDGEQKTSLDIFVTELELLGSKDDGTKEDAPARTTGPRPAARQAEVSAFDDEADIPF